LRGLLLRLVVGLPYSLLRGVLTEDIAHVFSWVCAMTSIIFITISFLSCWFLLYAFVEWTQDRGYVPTTQRGSGRKINAGDRRKQEQILNFSKKERGGKTCV